LKFSPLFDEAKVAHLPKKAVVTLCFLILSEFVSSTDLQREENLNSFNRESGSQIDSLELG